jgi:redox-sensitive bicupin YhaK (pirin superfamily)
MFRAASRAALRDPAHLYSGALMSGEPRQMALLANGRRHGPITRLIAPWDIGELTSPFVLLNYAEAARRARPLFGIHPPSGITTLAVVLNGELSFEDETGKQGEVGAAGFAWMKAGSVIWHEGGEDVREPLRLFHVWIEQPSAQRESVATSEYIAPAEVEQEGPVRVLLGEFGRARTRIRQAPADLNLLHVRLKDRQDFCYAPPEGHNVTWLAVDSGSLQLPEAGSVLWEQIAVFRDSVDMIEMQADGETSFVLGSARRRTQENR